jgi:hypothetical protein
MILHDLFEGRMKDLDIEYQDFLRSRGKNAMTDRQFQDAYGMTRTDWAKKNKEWTWQKERRPVAPDAHLFHEGAMKDLHADLADKYRKLAPKIEKYKDSYLAGELYDALEEIAAQHGAMAEFRRMMNSARNRAHMDYDTNPGGFQNWFWYLPFADDEQDVTEESQDDRNARIIAGEIEDAVAQKNMAVAEQKIKELNQLGYYIDQAGEIRPYGMYEGQVNENLRKWFKEKWVRFGPDGKIRGDCARGSSKEGKPKCLPQAKAHALGKKKRAGAAAKKRREDPNPERRGAAKNVATKVREATVNTIPAKSIIRGYTVFYNPNTKIISVTIGGTDEDAAIEKARMGTTNLKSYRLIVDKLIDRIEASETLEEKQDACYRKVKSRYKVWPSAYASGALVQCRKKGAANWGNKSKK